MKSSGANPFTGSARRGSRGDTQQQGNTVNGNGGHSGDDNKQQKGNTTKGNGGRSSDNNKHQQGNTTKGNGGKSSNNSKQGNNLEEYQIYSGGSDRHTRRQACSGKYRHDQAFRGLQEKISAFEKGTGIV